MSVGFGFSVGDFIAVIELVGTVIDALRESGQSRAEYLELIRQLYSLENALIHVNRVESDEADSSQLISLRQAASQCRTTIDQCLIKLEKYHPSLGFSSTGRSALRDRCRRIQWAMCRENDLEKFQLEILGHTESIQLLLATVQMRGAFNT